MVRRWYPPKFPFILKKLKKKLWNEIPIENWLKENKLRTKLSLIPKCTFESSKCLFYIKKYWVQVCRRKTSYAFWSAFLFSISNAVCFWFYKSCTLKLLTYSTTVAVIKLYIHKPTVKLDSMVLFPWFKITRKKVVIIICFPLILIFIQT